MEKVWKDFENHLLNEGLTGKRIKKLRSMFAAVTRELNLTNVNREQIEDFINRLHRNEFLKLDGSPYSGNAKKDIKGFLRQFFKWYEGNNEFYPKKVSWIKTRIRKEEMPEEKAIISVEEVRKLANSFSKPEYRLLTLLLFDSGFRIQEMLSVKKCNLSWEPFTENQNCFWINCNESKTIKRKIDVPLFTEDINNFCNSVYFENLASGDSLFGISYPYYNRKLKEYGKQLFDKTITCHSLRHSSATFYAREYDGDMILLANRYGWTYSSDQLKTYVRRSGAYQKRAAKKVYVNEVNRLKEENRLLAAKIKRIETWFEKEAKKEFAPKIIN